VDNAETSGGDCFWKKAFGKSQVEGQKRARKGPDLLNKLLFTGGATCYIGVTQP